MEEIKTQLEVGLGSERELLAYYRKATALRELHPELSEEIASKVFDQTHPALLPFAVSNNAQRIRDEFGALEAPGLPDDGSDPDAYRDRLWRRLESLIGARKTAKELSLLYPKAKII